ncbi:hypothetical protein A2153_05030 [Candidatus Gottesmanbacteria bacterium RBG_16_38_7b]|uniref:PIN domain-containing protein n=1 Tax=Candidatus Gottesmanbacteria bacterium RBG_16_38_7b TaxID=1798372 RepID=A0A1F5YHB8_9BACT|nr:MAG: hypothetical protein A2153_05030 [Candidatus Gottesmanbacteria bacterium RBG_16_38_7b]
MIILDTSIFITLFKEKESFQTIFDTLPDEEIALSVISIAEIELGFSLFQSVKKRAQINEFWNYIVNYKIKVIPVTEEIAKIYAKIQSQLMRTGVKLSHFDALIAATAAERDFLLVSKDIDFKRVKNLKLQLI